jgi:hypothetical protein
MRGIIALSALLVGVIAAQRAQTIPMPSQVDVVTDNCLEAFPEAVHVPVVDDDEQIDVDVYLVGDRGVSSTHADAVLAAAQEAYSPLGITLAKAGYRSATLEGTDSQGIIDQTKNLFGGARPPGSDVVWTLTSVNITAPGFGEAVAGQADCLGGVRYASSAFLVGEYTGTDGFGLAPIWFYGNLDAKVFAHENGHLLGAHHHYQDCVEGMLKETGPERAEVSPCTVMTNFVDFMSINFSVLEGAVVRAHAEEWAAP